MPQGSILGPLLFSIFVNDLPTVVEHAEVNMYADDTELHCCGNNLQTVERDLQSDLDRIHCWLGANRVQLNISKSLDYSLMAKFLFVQQVLVILV